MALYILGRIMFGVYFLISGINHFRNAGMLTGYSASKKVPYPKLAVLFSGAMLVVGGLGFIFGFFIAESSVLLILFLVPTSFIMHAFWKVSDPTHRMGEQINFMKNLALIGALLMMTLF